MSSAQIISYMSVAQLRLDGDLLMLLRRRRVCGTVLFSRRRPISSSPTLVPAFDSTTKPIPTTGSKPKNDRYPPLPRTCQGISLPSVVITFHGSATSRPGLPALILWGTNSRASAATQRYVWLIEHGDQTAAALGQLCSGDSKYLA
jgi:hypothetical protein